MIADSGMQTIHFTIADTPAPPLPPPRYVETKELAIELLRSRLESMRVPQNMSGKGFSGAGFKELTSGDRRAATLL